MCECVFWQKLGKRSGVRVYTIVQKYIKSLCEELFIFSGFCVKSESTNLITKVNTFAKHEYSAYYYHTLRVKQQKPHEQQQKKTEIISLNIVRRAATASFWIIEYSV